MPAGSAAVARAVPELTWNSLVEVSVAGLSTGHYFFAGGLGFLGAGDSGDFVGDGVGVEGAMKERTRITSCQRCSSVSFLRKDGMGLRPWVIW